jgi:hypothetical protein
MFDEMGIEEREELRTTRIDIEGGPETIKIGRT